MARVRSPNYPQISLPEAIKRIKQVHDVEQHIATGKAVIAKHLGYSSLSGSSLPVISALSKFGLLEEVSADQFRVSSLAQDILFPEDSVSKANAIRDAAMKPALFGEMMMQWEGRVPSEATIRAYLMRRNFAKSAIDKVIDSFRETMEFVTAESGEYAPAEVLGDASPTAEKPMAPSAAIAAGRREPASPPASGMRVTVVDDRLEVSASLSDMEAVEKLIRALQANKELLPTRSQLPAVEDETQDGID